MRSIKIKNPCKVEKFERDLKGRKIKTSIQIIEGNFLRTYHHFLLFQTKNGIRECFTKVSYGIDWTVLK